MHLGEDNYEGIMGVPRAVVKLEEISLLRQTLSLSPIPCLHQRGLSWTGSSTELLCTSRYYLPTVSPSAA